MTLIHRPITKVFAAAMALAALTGCGGEGASSNSPVPAPVATSAPASNPPSQGFDLAHSPFTLRQTQPTPFLVLGYGFRATGGPFDDIADPASLDGSLALGVRLVTVADLRLSLGGLGEGALVPNGGGGVSGGNIVALSFNALGGSGSLSLLYGPQAIPLTSTAFLSFSRVARGQSDPYPLDNVALVYGVAAPAAAIPGAGIVRYAGQQAGDGVDVDFATGRVTGRLQIEGGMVDIIDAALTAERTGFTGRVMGGGGQIDTTIEARFTGPAAGEIMYRWVHPVGSRKPAAVGGLIRVG